MSIFDNISGLSGENIATEVLAYLLSSPDSHVPLQKLFFYRLIEAPMSSGQLKMEILTQPLFSNGRPDFIAWTNDSLFIFETKLGSSLSGENQLISYAGIFDNIRDFKTVFPDIEPEKVMRKYLVLIAPRDTIESSSVQTDREALRTYNKNFMTYCEEKNVIFRSISWEEIVNDLDKTNPLQYELCQYVRTYIGQEVTAEEKMVLKDNNVPNALMKIANKIKAIRGGLSLNEFRPTKISQSYSYLGFGLEHSALSFAFGYYLDLWGKYNAPVFLHLREEWIKDKRDDVMRALRKCNFVKDAEFEYIYPFDVDNIARWKEQLEHLLQEFQNEIQKVSHP